MTLFHRKTYSHIWIFSMAWVGLFERYSCWRNNPCQLPLRVPKLIQPSKTNPTFQFCRSRKESSVHSGPLCTRPMPFGILVQTLEMEGFLLNNNMERCRYYIIMRPNIAQYFELKPRFVRQRILQNKSAAIQIGGS